MYLPKLREIREALTSFFSAPYTTAYPSGSFVPAPEYRGFPRFQPVSCVGCGACAQVCPSGAITIRDDAVTRTLTINYGSCIQCGQCHEHCITGAGIIPTTHYSLPVGDRYAPELLESIEKELVVCEGCGRPIAPRDQLRWVRRRLGARAYANPTLLMMLQEDGFDPEPSPTRERLRREDYGKILCPNCRQTVGLADEFQ